MILLDGLEQSLLCCNLVHERYGVHAISRCILAVKGEAAGVAGFSSGGSSRKTAK